MKSIVTDVCDGVLISRQQYSSTKKLPDVTRSSKQRVSGPKKRLVSLQKERKKKEEEIGLSLPRRKHEILKIGIHF